MDPRSDQEPNTAGSDAEQLKSQAKQAGAEAAQWAREAGHEQLERAKRSSLEKAETVRQQAADQAASVASAVGRTAETLDQQGQHSLASMAGGFANDLDRFARRLKDGSLDDLVRETRTLARQNPTLFLAGSVGVGLALARFLKASPYRSEGYGAQRHVTGDDSVDFTDEFSRDRDALADDAVGDDYPDSDGYAATAAGNVPDDAAGSYRAGTAPVSDRGIGRSDESYSTAATPGSGIAQQTGNDDAERDDTRPINRFE